MSLRCAPLLPASLAAVAWIFGNASYSAIPGQGEINVSRSFHWNEALSVQARRHAKVAITGGEVHALLLPHAGCDLLLRFDFTLNPSISGYVYFQRWEMHACELG